MNSVYALLSTFPRMHVRKVGKEWHAELHRKGSRRLLLLYAWSMVYA